MDQRQNISSGTPWEDIAGYSRAVRIGNIIHVAGTTASDEDGKVIGVNDPAKQTRYILNKIKQALGDAGASLDDVIRTRIYVTDITRWEEVSRVHGEVFRDIRPANTLIEVSALVTPEHLVEIEAEAILQVGR